MFSPAYVGLYSPRHYKQKAACAPAQVPVWLLKATRGFLRSFQWARDAADRLVSAP